MHIVKSPLGPSSCSRTFSKRCQLIFFHLHHDQKYYYLHTWGNHEILNLFETQPELSSKKSNMDFSKACTNAIYTKYQEESENSFLKCLVMSKVIYFVIWIVSTLLLEKISDWKTVVDSLVVLSRSGLFGIRTLKQWIAAAAAAKCSLKAKPLLEKPIFFHFHHIIWNVLCHDLLITISAAFLRSINFPHTALPMTCDIILSTWDVKYGSPVASTLCLKSIKNVSNGTWRW